MRFDILSVFPEFFDVLKLSLVGKAQERGIISVTAHDLRAWANDPHRTVDDTPAGGGAGMVMRPDIWGKALDELLAGETDGCVLALPTPSGTPLTQRHCEELAASARHILIACGRYEGIDARVAEHYASRGIRVFEYSLGDYVLNGGEVAAVALVEAVSRLIPSMVGNPDSLIEESHSRAGLLEYPVYTRPQEWEGLSLPGVLNSGNHEAIRRWRRDRSLEKTALRRPDMIARLTWDQLDAADRHTLARLGWLCAKDGSPRSAFTRVACQSDAEILASLAKRTFPDAAPDYLPSEAIEEFITENLSVSRFESYLRDPHWLALLAFVQGEDEPVGYTLSLLPDEDTVAGVEEGAPSDVVLDGQPRRGPLIELSKFYIDAPWRSSGASTLLWEHTRAELSKCVAHWGNPYVWLGTNSRNKRAQKAYKRLGFQKVGRRTFYVGDQPNSDVVFARPLHMR